jgi:hypothetical protein
MRVTVAHGKPAPRETETYRRINAEDRAPFAAICSQARENLTLVIDMILIHNERPVRGDVPRTSLNKAIVVFSAAAWERLVADLRSLSVRKPDPRQHTMVKSAGAYLSRGEGSGRTLAILAGVSGGRLPGDWLIRLPTSGSGRTLHFAPAQPGAAADLAESADFWIKARNNIAHRQAPDALIWAYGSGDSRTPDRRTFNTTLARISMTTFLQLIDQTIRVIADAGQMTEPEQLWLPPHWLDGKLRPGERGVYDEDPLRLWDGRSLSYGG